MAGRGKVSAGQDRRELVLDSYGRLSRVPETGELEKIDTQHADNRTVIERSGGVLGEELQDGLSAWKRGVRRPGWERLLERVQSGESDGIVVWHTDRLFRQPRDLETLIDLADRGFKVLSAHGVRDLADPDDRFILRIEVAHAARSSDDTQRRIKRRFATLRENGVAHIPGRVFGFPGKDRSVDGPKDERPDVPADVIERERVALQEGTRAILAGLSQRAVSEGWNAAGLRTVTGGLWTPVKVREVLLRPRNAGLIEHEGDLVGRMRGEPIVDPEEFERLRALFAGRRRGRRPGGVYVASGLLTCAVCGKAMTGRPHNGTYKKDGAKRRQYTCPKSNGGCGKVSADMRAVDDVLREFTITRLSDSQHAAAIAAARAQVAERVAEVNKEIVECETLQQALADRLGRREVTLDSFDKANRPLSEALARLTAEREALSGGNPEGPTEALSADVVAGQWDDGETGEKRAMLVSALGRMRMVVDPADKTGQRRFNPLRVRPVPPEQQTA